MFFLTHTFLLQKKKGGAVSDNLNQAFEQMCFINWKKWCNIFLVLDQGLWSNRHRAFSIQQVGREGGSAYYTCHLFTMKNMYSELVGKRELSEYLWRDIPEVWEYLAKTLSNVWTWIFRHSKDTVLNWHVFCLFSLFCNWSIFVLQCCCDITSASDMFLNFEPSLSVSGLSIHVLGLVVVAGFIAGRTLTGKNHSPGDFTSGESKFPKLCIPRRENFPKSQWPQ